MFHKVKIGKNFPKEINSIIEIPKESHNKYEYDEELEVFKLDRVLHSPLHYPADYGLIPETRAEDGDHLDIMVLGNNPTFPGCVVKSRPIGVMRMIDDGEKDYKILGVQSDNPRFTSIKDLEDLQKHNPHLLKEIAHFFEAYKHLEDKEVKTEGWGNREEAIKEIEKTHKAFKQQG
ncbi:MAG: inorganic diphosphatase [Candidatus Paceibacterota bacterium]